MGSAHARNIRLNLCKLYDGPIRLLADHDFTVKLNRLHEAVGWYQYIYIYIESANNKG